MARFILFFLAVVFYRSVFSVDCGSLYSKTACQGEPQCDWDPNAADTCQLAVGQPTCDLCTCNSAVPLDIIFVLDSSGSIGYDNFELEKAWLQYIFNGQISPDSRVAFIIFATTVNAGANPCNPPLAFWPCGATFGSKALMTGPLVNFVGGIVWTQGWTNTQEAYKQALDWFDAYGLPNRKKIAVILTDGQPNRPVNNYDPCQHRAFADSLGVQCVLVGVGNGWIAQNGPQKVGCLVSDPADMFYVENFNSFDSINSAFLSRLCPATNRVVITEVKPGRSDNFGLNVVFSNEEFDNWRGRFLEFYNTGATLSLEQIRMEGFVKTGLAPTFPINVPVNTYVVFYEEDPTSSEDDISCYLCHETCTLVKNCAEPTGFSYIGGDWTNYPGDSNCQNTANDDIHGPNLNTRSSIWDVVDPAPGNGGGRCWGPNASDNPAVYIPCRICPDYSTYDCCIDPAMNEGSWNQVIYDVQTSTILEIDTVTYGSDPDWPLVKDGYSYELIAKTYPNDAGANWIQSCYEWGTPGTDPLSNCPPKCDLDSCRQGGNNNAQCSQSGTCICTDNYYANGIGCSQIPEVGLCYAVWQKLNESEHVMRFVWSGVLFAEKEYVLYYKDLQSGINATYITTATAADVTDDQILWEGISVPAGYVAVRVTDDYGAQVIGPAVACPVSTWYPTESPTGAPTSPPTPAPTSNPTPSPLAPPRACFWRDCNSNPIDFTNVNFCECSNYNKGFPIGFDPACCRRNSTYHVIGTWNINNLGKTNNKPNGLSCETQDVNWIPRANPWPLFIKCTTSFTIRTIVRWRIRFWKALCVKNCDSINTRRLLSFQDRRLLSNNVTVDLTEGGFTLTPLDGQVEINQTTWPPQRVVNILVESEYTPGTDDAEFESIYYGELIDCTNYDDGNPACHVVYPNPVKIVVTRSIECQGAQCGEQTEPKIPGYIWGIIGGLVVFLCLLAALIYLFWWRTAVAKKNLADTREEAANVIADNEAGFGADLDTGDVVQNPIATMNPAHEMPRDEIGRQQDLLKTNQPWEVADVKDNRINYKQEFGGYQTNRRG